MQFILAEILEEPPNPAELPTLAGLSGRYLVLEAISEGKIKLGLFGSDFDQFWKMNSQY